MQCIIFAVLASVYCLSVHLVFPHQVICNNFADCLFFSSGTIIRAEFQFLQYFSYEPEVMTHIMAAERIMNVI